MTVPLHDDLRPFAPLLGTWRGEGRGEFPTISPFDYEEEIVIEHAGDAWLAYRQTSWAPASGETLHWERGFVRPAADDGVELVLAHPIGVVEVAHGRLVPGGLETSTADGHVGRTHTGLGVTALVRRYRWNGDVLAYELDMATEGTALTRHLVGSLRRA